MDNSFVHLHLHTEKSLLDGTTRTNQVGGIISSLGQTKAAMTDHGTMSGLLDFYTGCKEAGVTPLIGWEAYVTPDKYIKEKDTPRWHLIMVAMNEVGKRNLFILSQIAWTDGFYTKPRIDYNDLATYNEGIIALTGCMGAEIPRALENGDPKEALEAMKRYKSWFDDRLYTEIQPHNREGLNDVLMAMAAELGVKPVATVDSHYDHCTSKATEELVLAMQQTSSMKASDKEYAKLMYGESLKADGVIQRLNTLWPNRRLQFHHHDLHIMSREEIVSALDKQGLPGNELADTTNEIGERCEGYEIKTGQVYLPKAVEFKDKTSDEYLRELTYEGLERRGKHLDQEYIDRVEEELQTLKDKGFADYFLIVWDLINEARKRNIYIGPGRGSAAGSLVSYALGITKIDPIKYNLLFFRFISADRNDFPDIDIDIEHTRRDELKDYFREKYGEALSISTYAQFKAKGLIRSIARALAIPLAEVDAACKHFETLEEYEDGDASALKTFKNKHPYILPYAQKLEGLTSGSGMHAAGIVIADRPMHLITPVETRTDPEDKKKRVPVTALDMNDAATLGLIKFDFLGLKNLTIIHDAIDLIKERHDVDIDWEEMEPDDVNVLKMLDGSHTTGVFQMESSAYRNLLTEMGVDNFEDMVASNALVRPGAYTTVKDDYVARKKGTQKVVYPHDDVEEFLTASYGLYIYQEQVMQLSVYLGGFSWGEAEKLRKIIGKKRDVAEFQPFYEKWMTNASEKIGEKEAEKMWHDFEKHAGYSFNRSHAVAYSYVGYVTAWLKHYYPIEYMYALLKHEKEDALRMHYLLETKRLGIDIQAPDVNISQEKMSLYDKSLLFGISDIKNVGFQAAKHLIERRPFMSWSDFSERIEKRKCNSRVVESLVAVDALRNVVDAPRNTSARDNYMEYLQYPIDLDDVDNLGFDFAKMEDCEERGTHLICGVVKAIKRTDKYVRVEFEDITATYTCFAKMDCDLSTGEVVAALVADKAILGHARISGLPERIANGKEEGFEKLLAGTTFKDVEELYKFGIGDLAEDKSLVVPLYVRKITTKTGKNMAFVHVSDGNNVEKVTLFPHQWEKLQKSIHEWEPLCVQLKWLDGGGRTVKDKGLMNAAKLLEKKKEAMHV